MSVDPKHIDFGAITNAAAKKVLPNTKVSGSDGHKIDFAAATEEGLKKKEPAQSATTPPASSAGAGTPISTLPLSDPTKPFDFTPKWEGISEDEANYKGFRNSDKSLLDNLLQKHKVYGDPLASIRNNLGLPEVQGIIPQVSTRPFFKEYEAAKALESSIQEKIKNTPSETTVFTMPGAVGTPIPSKKETDLENDLAEAQNLRKKAWRELVIEGENKVDAVVRTDQSGNLLKKTFNRLLATNPTSSSLAGAAMSLEVQDKINKLPSQFVTGLNYLKGVEPVEYERITQALSKGMPISESQIANITAQGIDIEEERLKKNQRDKIISPDEFNKKAQELYEVKKKNLVDNEEVLRAFLSNGIAEMGDEIGKASQVGNVLSPQKQVTDYLFGHTWNYSDDEIKKYGETYAKQNGIDPSSPQVQKAIKYLQDNEGAMIMQNSIAKAGGIREFFKGAADPIRGVSNFIEDLGKSSNDVYAEAQSQGNVNVSEKRLKAEDTGVRGVINEVLKGTGQFATQAGMMYGVSGGIGALAEGIAGKAGAEMLAASRAANIKPVIAFDDATGKLALSNVLNNAKNPLSVFTTSYAMAYDSNLKQALQYTSDNSLAKKAAAFNSTMEGLTELVLSPLEIAEGIVHKFTKGQTKDLLKILSDKSLKSDPSKLTQYATKFVKGVLGTSKVAGAEIGEELVTQISDYATNAYLNPNSESFKNRDLADELMTTAYQTGLTMAIPSLLNGISSAKANTFSKGSLMVAAQNRQKMIDAYKQDFANGKIDQNQLNANISLINTAAQANAELPKKADGTSLTTNEKADYIFSRVTEAMLQNKANRVKDAAEKQIISKQILEQQNYRAAILGNEKIEQDPVYKVDGNDVTKSQFIKMAKDENSDEHNFEVENDDATKAQFQKIAGVDKSQIPPAEQVKNENIELLQTLKGKETIPEFEYNAIVSNPDLALREIADQALGFTRKDGQRVPHEFGGQEEQVRKAYSDAIVDRAIEMFPKEQVDAAALSEREKYGLEPLKPTYRGTSLSEWESVLNGGFFESKEGFGDNPNKRTWVSDKKEYSDDYVKSSDNGVLVEFKPEAIDKSSVESGQQNDDTGVRLGIGLKLEDVQMVTDKDGNIIYEAPAEQPQEKAQPVKSKALSKFKEKHLSQSKTENNATKKREVSESSQQQHKGTEGIRIPTETSSSNSNEQSRESKKEVVPDVSGKEEGNVEDIEQQLNNNQTKVKEGKGSWRKSFNETADAMRKKDILRAIADVSTDKTELNDISEAAKGLPEGLRSEINYAVEHKLKSLPTQEVKAEQPDVSEKERAEKIESLKAEKQQKVNEVTKPEITFDTGLSLTDLAGTSESNRQLHDDYKSQLASLKNIVNCLWQ